MSRNSDIRLEYFSEKLNSILNKFADENGISVQSADDLHAQIVELFQKNPQIDHYPDRYMIHRGIQQRR